MLGGRIDKKGFIISTVIIGIMIFVGNHLAWAWSALDTAKLQGYSIGEIVLLLKILGASHATMSYILDLIAGYVLTLAIGFKIIRGTYRKSVGSYSIKKCA